MTKAPESHRLFLNIQMSFQKLLWAVAVALKEKNLTHRDAQFKECAAALFSICKKNLAAIRALEVAGGTSEKMLTYARGQVDSVVAKARGVTSDAQQNTLPSCPSSGILLEVSDSALNQKETERSEQILVGKENVLTPKRKFEARVWRSCLKSIKKSKLRLCRSHSCDDIGKETVFDRKYDSVKINSDNCYPNVKHLSNISVLENADCRIESQNKSLFEKSENLNSTSIYDGGKGTASLLEQCAGNSSPQKMEYPVTDVKGFTVEDTPEKEKDNSGCISASQEDISSPSVFPALSKKSIVGFEPDRCERSPDIFDFCESPPKGAGEDVLHEETINELKSGAFKELDVSANVTNYDACLPPQFLVHPDPLISCADPLISMIPVDEYSGELTKEQEVCFENECSNESSQLLEKSANEVLVEPECRLVEVVAVIDDSNLILDEKEIFSPECGDHEDGDFVDGSLHEPPPLYEGADSYEVSSLKEDNSLSVVENTFDDGAYLNGSSLETEKEICTSTPLVHLSNKLVMKSRPAWRVETGPGLKVRVRLSKDWDIVGRDTPVSPNNDTDNSANQKSSEDVSTVSEGNGVMTELNVCCEEMDVSDNDVKVAPQKSQLSVERLTSVDSSGTSMESYTLMEIKNRLAIERTLEADSSDVASLNFESSSTSGQAEMSTESGSSARSVAEIESDADNMKISDTDVTLFSERGIQTIVEVSPEVAIKCYKKSPSISSNKNPSDGEEIDSDVEDKIPKIPIAERFEGFLSTPKSLSDDDEDTPLIQLISESSKASVAKKHVSHEENDSSSEDELPLVQLIDGSSSSNLTSHKQNNFFPFRLDTDNEQFDASKEDNLPLSQLISQKGNIDEKSENDFGIKTGVPVQDCFKLEVGEDKLPLIQLSKPCKEADRLSHQADNQEVKRSFSALYPPSPLDSKPNEREIRHFKDISRATNPDESISGITQINCGESLLSDCVDHAEEMFSAEPDPELPFQLGSISEANKKSLASLSYHFDELFADISSGTAIKTSEKVITNITPEESLNENYGKTEEVDETSRVSYKSSLSARFDELIAENCSRTPPRSVKEVKEEPITECWSNNSCGKTEEAGESSQVVKPSLSVRSDGLLVENCSETPPKRLTEVKEEESESDRSTGKSKQKLTLESYKARKKLDLASYEPKKEIREVECKQQVEVKPELVYPKKIYNIRLKKKEKKHRTHRIHNHRQSTDSDDTCSTQNSHIHRPPARSGEPYCAKNGLNHWQTTDSDETYSRKNSHSHWQSTDADETYSRKKTHHHRQSIDSYESYSRKNIHNHRQSTDSDETYSRKNSRNHRPSADSDESSYGSKHILSHRQSSDSDPSSRTKYIQSRRQSTASSSSSAQHTVIEENVKKTVCENTKTVLHAMNTLSDVVEKEMLLTIPAITDNKERMRKLKRLTQVSTISKQLLENLMAIAPSSVREMTCVPTLKS